MTLSPVRYGIDLGGTKIEAIALTADGFQLERLRVPTPRDDYAATLEAIAGLLRPLIAAYGAGAVGVGIPGAISPHSGLVKNANSTWLIGRPLVGDLEAALGQSVRVANDADCFALSEATDGAAAGVPTAFAVILGTGVGGGLVVDGRVVSGPNAIGGEWGHNPLPWPEGWPHGDEFPGPDCYCGKSGCVETFLSGPGLARDHTGATGERRTAAEIAAAAAAGDPVRLSTMERYCDRLARALAVVINIIDPHVIVLGGGLSNVPLLYERVPELLGQWVFSDAVATGLLPARHGDSSGVRGAAWLWDQGAGRVRVSGAEGKG